MSRFLVTGGGGFIGSNLVRKLLESGHNVRVLDNFSTGQRKNLHDINSQIELIEGDVRSYHIVKDSMKGIDYVLHEAALPSVPRSVNDPITSNEVNVVGTLNILHAARDESVKRVVFASSSSVYGDNEVQPKTETLTPNPLSPYAVSKLAAENYCSVFYRIFGLKTVILRYFNVFGPGQDPNSQYSAVIPKFIGMMKAGQRPVIFGDGSQSRDFTYIDNVVHANLLACETESDVFGRPLNCATHSRIELRSLVAALNELLGTNLEPVFRPVRLGDVKDSYADISRASELLSYKPLVDFRTGLEKTIESQR